MMFSIQQGQFKHNDHPFFCIGFNYHPSISGCHYWQLWDAQRIEQDFQEMKRRGFNTVRFFLFWAHFEPEPGYYDPVVSARLTELVALAQKHNLYCIPALLTIWMNGQLFDLPWRQGRDLWVDAEMTYREMQYVQHIATLLKDATNILAYDLGDEVIHVDLASARSLRPAQVNAWQSALANTIRQADPGALVLQGNEASAILGDHSFRLEHSHALDILAIHGFPVWTPFAIESISCYKASLYVSFLVQMARIYGTVLIDELGNYGADDEVARGFLYATCHSVLANGARGIIAWCWQDFESNVKPFDKSPNERFVGFLKTDGSPKATLPVLQDFAQQATHKWPNLSIAPAPIGIYIPEREVANEANYLEAVASPATGAFYAYLLLKQAHLPCEFTRGPLNNYQLVICPSVEQITLHEQELLASYVEHGGMLYYSVANYLHGFGSEKLFGVRLHDFTLNPEELASFTWQAEEYPLYWPEHTNTWLQFPIIHATSAEVLTLFPNGTPALTRHSYGRGTAYYLNAPFELQLNIPYRLQQRSWYHFYEYLAHMAGVSCPISADHPSIEVALADDEQHHYAFLINHSSDEVRTMLLWNTNEQKQQTRPIILAGKGVQVLSWDRASPSSATVIHDEPGSARN